MPRFSFPLFIVATAALASECDAVRNSIGNPWYANFRSGGLYSTQRNSKEELTLPGTDIFVSPKDSFDFLPSPGYNALVEELEQDPIFSASSDEDIVRGSDENLANWAASRLVGHEARTTLQKRISPRPNESLSGKILTIEAAEVVVRTDQAVLCHALEKDAHLCHKLHMPMDITEVTVSPNGKASMFWVACHYGEGKDGDTLCHVMNVGDFMYLLPGDMTTMGEIRKKGLKTMGRDTSGDDFIYSFVSESHVMQTEKSTQAEIEQLGECSQTDNEVGEYLSHFVATMILDHTGGGKIHDPDTPVKTIRYDNNFDVQKVLEMAKDNVIAITFVIPVENKKCLATIEEDEAKSLGVTIDLYAQQSIPASKKAKLRNSNSSSKLADYTNGPCKDMIIEYAYPKHDDDVEEEE